MLVLTRRVGEVIMIGDDIKITVHDIRGKQVKIKVSAPPDLAVNRLEVYQKIREEKGNP